jgi:acetoin utilization protein AcuB
MLVKDWMSTKVVSIDVDASMQDALKLLKDHGIRMLPVLKKGKLAGIVTDRDVKRASASDATTLEVHELLYLISTIKVKDIMTPNPATVPDDYTVEETARLLLEHKISGVPVVDSTGAVIGIITQTDLFKVIISLTGADQKGMQFALEVQDMPGAVTELIDVIRKHGGRILSVLSSADLAPRGFRRVYLRIYDVTPNGLDMLKANLMEKARFLYMVDHSEKRRIMH